MAAGFMEWTPEELEELQSKENKHVKRRLIENESEIHSAKVQIANLSTLACDVSIGQDEGFIVFVSPLQNGRVELIPLGRKSPRESREILSSLKAKYGSNVIADVPMGMHHHFNKF